MPQRSRARPSARRAPLLVLAGGLSVLALLVGCGTVTPSGSPVPIGPTSDNQPPSAMPSTGPSGAPGGSPTPSTAPSGSPTPTPPPGPAIAWRRVAVPGVAATTERVAIGPNRIVVAVDSQAVDGTPTGHVAFWSSVDTVHWVASSHVPAADDGIVTAVAAAGRGFVAVGTDAAAVRPRVWTSADGRSWVASPTIATAAGATGAGMSSIAAGSDSLVAGGWMDVPGQRRAMAWVSADAGQSWKPSIVDGSGPRAQVMSVAAGGPGWVATGIRDATAAFWLSRDGLAWVHIVPQPPVAGGFGAESSADGIACTAARCVAVGQGPSAGDGWAWWSDEPDHWNTVGPADALAGGASRAAAAFGGGFVAGGAGAAGLFGIWTTADGRRWTPSAHEGGPVGIVGDLASDGTRIVAVGSPFDGGSGFAVWIGSAAP